MSTPEQVTELLQAWKIRGDAQAEQELFVVVERELIRVARGALARNPDLAHRIDPRELVNEAYLKLREYSIATTSRGPFFFLMKRVMKRFLIDLVRERQAEKRPQTKLRVMDTAVVANLQTPGEVGPIELYEALDSLRSIDPRQADAIELKMIGLTSEEIADELAVSRASITRDLAQGRAYLAVQLGLPGEWLQV